MRLRAREDIESVYTFYEFRDFFRDVRPFRSSSYCIPRTRKAHFDHTAARELDRELLIRELDEPFVAGRSGRTVSHDSVESVRIDYVM